MSAQELQHDCVHITARSRLPESFVSSAGDPGTSSGAHCVKLARSRLKKSLFCLEPF